MPAPDEKADLHRYLRGARKALVWKLEGLSEYDVRRPMVATGTNLLGLVKHMAGVEAGYFGVTFDRPFPEPMPWFDDAAGFLPDDDNLWGGDGDYWPQHRARLEEAARLGGAQSAP